VVLGNCTYASPLAVIVSIFSLRHLTNRPVNDTFDTWTPSGLGCLPLTFIFLFIVLDEFSVAQCFFFLRLIHSFTRSLPSDFDGSPCGFA
jgi:hypothetical protein